MWKEQATAIPQSHIETLLTVTRVKLWHLEQTNDKQASSSYGPNHFTGPKSHTLRPQPSTPDAHARPVSHEDLDTLWQSTCPKAERSPPVQGIARSRRTSWRRQSWPGTETQPLRWLSKCEACLVGRPPSRPGTAGQGGPGPFGMQARSL